MLIRHGFTRGRRRIGRCGRRCRSAGARPYAIARRLECRTPASRRDLETRRPALLQRGSGGPPPTSRSGFAIPAAWSPMRQGGTDPRGRGWAWRPIGCVRGPGFVRACDEAAPTGGSSRGCSARSRSTKRQSPPMISAVPTTRPAHVEGQGGGAPLTLRRSMACQPVPPRASVRPNAAFASRGAWSAQPLPPGRELLAVAGLRVRQCGPQRLKPPAERDLDTRHPPTLGDETRDRLADERNRPSRAAGTVSARRGEFGSLAADRALRAAHAAAPARILRRVVVSTTEVLVRAVSSSSVDPAETRAAPDAARGRRRGVRSRAGGELAGTGGRSVPPRRASCQGRQSPREGRSSPRSSARAPALLQGGGSDAGRALGGDEPPGRTSRPPCRSAIADSRRRRLLSLPLVRAGPPQLATGDGCYHAPPCGTAPTAIRRARPFDG